MANADSGTGRRPGQPTESLDLVLTFDGELASRGELPAAELGAALQGWDRFLQLAYYSHEAAILELPKGSTSFQVEFRVRRVSKGSFVVTAALFIGTTALSGVIGNRTDAAVKKVWHWASKLVKSHIKAKREKGTLDGVVDELESLAKVEEVRLSDNREDSEDFASALNTALDYATVPLDSSAAKAVLSLKGQTIDIEIDAKGRAAIHAPFTPPTLDPDADDVIDAAVKFIRINKKTGYGLFTFVRPQDESQVAQQQRFHCDDKSIRRRANQYTGAFHQDVPLTVRMQRKAYAAHRRGHYWLIIGTTDPAKPEPDLFNQALPKRPKKSPDKKP